MTATEQVIPVTGEDSGIINKNFPRPSAEVVERLSKLPIANISDAMNKHGVMHYEIRPISQGLHFCGPALTCGSLDLTVKIFALSLIKPGDVFIQASGGIHEYACFGELGSNGVKSRGGAGAIVDGAVRDVLGIKEVGLPVFARSVTPRNYHYPFGQPFGSVNRPVVCGGVLVNPGDVIVASEEGVVVVPLSMAEKVATAAEKIQAEEDQRREGIRSGKIPYDKIEEQLRSAGYSIR